MIVLAPNNIYFKLIASTVSDLDSIKFEHTPSAVLLSDMLADKADAAFVPILDLVKEQDVKVSQRIGLSFNYVLSNSFYYYKKGEKSIDNLVLCGDISSTEAILAKIIFEEDYGTTPKITLGNYDSSVENNYLLVGDANLTDDRFEQGVNFNDSVSELIGFPFVSHVLVAKDEETILKLEEILEESELNLLSKFKELAHSLGLSTKAYNFVKGNIHEMNVKLFEEHIDGINQLLRLPFYHQLTDDIVELKFVD